MTGACFAAVIATPLPGGLRLGISGDAVVNAVEFLPPGTPLREPSTIVAAAVVQWLRRYFDDPRTRSGDLPLAAAATAYQARVREALLAIPVGGARSYGALARELGSAPRAIAGACRANPVPLLVPCHRVIGSAGLGGFMGSLGGPAVRLKAWLLEHEGH